MNRTRYTPQGERNVSARCRPSRLRCLPLSTGVSLDVRNGKTQNGRSTLNAAIVLALLAIGWFPSGARPASDICGHPIEGRATILREGEALAAFAVSLADSTSRQRRGLMHCPHLPDGHGMLFVYHEKRPRVFWMKNTPLALAIIFVTEDGRIAAIEKGAPQSLTRIPSPGPVRYVLEINAAEARGLRRGDRLQWARTPRQP